MTGNERSRLIEEVEDGGDVELLETARALRDGMREMSDDRLTSHPHAAHIDRVASGRIDDLPEGLRWIEAHLEACEVCRRAVRAAEATLADGNPRAASKAGPWRLLARTVLHPALAAVYLLGFASLASWIVLREPAPPAVPLLVFAEPLLRHAGDPRGTLELPARALQAQSVHLVLQTDRDGLDDPSARFRLALTDSAGRVVWESELSGHRFSEIGMASLTLPSRTVRPGTDYRLTLQRAAETPPLFERRIRFVE